MKVRKIVSLLLVLTFMAALFSACKGGSDNTEQKAAAGEGKVTYPVTVTNTFDGREITVDQRPTKVLTLGPNCTELFAALGLGDLVVGRSLVNHSRGPLDEYADIVNNIPELNHSSATREAILSSGADFIYSLDWEVGEEGLVIDEVQGLGMNVYVNCAKTSSDAVFISMDDQPAYKANGANTKGAWAWKSLYSLLSAADKTAFGKHLEAGEHTLYIYACEPGFKLGLCNMCNTESLDDFKSDVANLNLDDVLSGIESLSGAEGKSQIYSLDGRRLNRAQAGVNIVRQADKVFKQVIK